MKKITILGVLILCFLFYISFDNFKEIKAFNSDGYVFADNKIQEYLYAGSSDKIVETISVNENDLTYSRWGSIYVGETSKKKINDAYPVFIKDGQAFVFINDDNDLIDTKFKVSEGYEGLIINDSSAFNDDLVRADYNEYIFTRLSNGIYINTQEITITTFAHEYIIPLNSFIYMTPNYIRYMVEVNGTYHYREILDIDENSIMSFDNLDITYGELLLKLGETVEVDEKTIEDITKNPEDEKNKESDIINNNTDEKDKNKDNKNDGKKDSNGSESKKQEKDIVYPVITLTKLDPDIYSLDMEIEIKDESDRIYDQLTVTLFEPNEREYHYAYVSLDAASAVKEIINLKPNTDYIFNATYSYIDKAGNVVKNARIVDKNGKEVIDYKFTTDAISTLNPVSFISIDNTDDIYSDYFILDNIKIGINEDNQKTVKAIATAKITLIDSNTNEKYISTISTSQVNDLKLGNSIKYVSDHILKSNSQYSGYIQLYDTFGNELPVDNTTNTIESVKTCMCLPEIKVKILKDRTGNADIVYEDKDIVNTDNVDIKHFLIKLEKEDGQYIKWSNLDYQYFDDENKVSLKNLSLNESYKLHILVEADINDGQGVVQHEILTKNLNIIWEKPVIVLKSLSTNVYSIDVEVDATDKKRDFGKYLTLEISEYDNPSEVTKKQVALKRDDNYQLSFTADSLKPNTKYKLKAYYDYVNEDGDNDIAYVIDENGQEIKAYEFTTKTIDTLKSISFGETILNSQVYSNYIAIDSISLVMDGDNADTINAIGKFVIRLKDENGKEYVNTLGASVINSLKNGKTVSFISVNELKSNSVINGEFELYDNFGNKLPYDTNTNKFTTRTCKELPEIEITISQLADFKTVRISLDKINNQENIDYEISGLMVEITLKDGTFVDSSYFSTGDIKLATITNLTHDIEYVANVYCTCDVNDGCGKTVHKVAANSFIISNKVQQAEVIIKPERPIEETIPKGQKPYPDVPHEDPIVYPEWEQPYIKVKNFKVNVYSLELELDVYDPANVIYNGVTYEIKRADGNKAGKTEIRKTYMTTFGNNKILLSSMEPSSNFIFNATYTYKDKYGNVVNDQYRLLDAEENPIIDKAFTTKDISELGNLVLNPIDTTYDFIYSNRVVLGNVSFDVNQTTNDALSSISRGVVYMTNSKNEEYSFSIGSTVLSSMKNGSTVSLSTASKLASGENWTGHIMFYDRYNNEIVAINKDFTTRTCYNLPKFSIIPTKTSNSSIKFKVTETANDDGIPYSNMRVYLTDTDNVLVQVNGHDYTEVVDGVAELTNLSLDESYIAKLYIDCDINDGYQTVSREIYTYRFQTGSISDLGNLLLNITNISETEKYADDKYQRIVLDVALSEDTKTELLQYIYYIDVKLAKDDGETITYTLTDEEVTQLLSNNKIALDSYLFTPYKKLKSNSSYVLSFTAKARENENSQSVDVKVVTSTKRIKIGRKPVEVFVTNQYAYTGCISADFLILDEDNTIIGDEVTLRVLKVETDAKTGKTTESIAGSFLLEKNKEGYTKIKMSNDASYSSDGNSYNIEANKDYQFKIFAKEANLESGLEYNYLIWKSPLFNTYAGVEGEIGLVRLSNYYILRDQSFLNEYTQVEYIKATGTQYIDTGVIIDYSKTIRIEQVFEVPSIGPRYCLTGSYDSYNELDIEIASNYIRTWQNYDRLNVGSISANTKNTVIFEGKNGSFTININGKTGTGSMVTSGTDGKVQRIFNDHRGNTTTFAGHTLYSAKYYLGGKLIRDFIPAVRKIDGVAGLYDKVEKKFYTNTGTGTFVVGKAVPDYDGEIDGSKEYLAEFYINIEDNNSFLSSLSEENRNKLYVELKNYVNGKLVDTNTKIETVQYTGESSYSLFATVNKDNNKNNYYVASLFIALDGGERLYIGSTQFSTEAEIYTISNLTEFSTLCGSNRKYVVINDLELDSNYEFNGSWYGSYYGNSSNQFNAQVDFQGHTFKFSSRCALIGYIGKTGQIKNLVFETNAKTNTTSTSATNTYYVGTLCTINNGLISNIKVIHTEEAYGENQYASYWTKVPDGENVPHYQYRRRNGAICCDNNGTIENFAVDFQGVFSCTELTGAAVVANNAGGVVRNGYIYSSTNEDNKALISYRGSNWIGAVVGENRSGSKIENVYAIADVVLLNSNINSVGILAGNQYGTAKNCYVVGNTTYNENPTNYGPGVGYTSANYKNENIFYISDYSYISTNNTAYNNIASVLALRNTTWQENILNNGNGSFNVTNLIKAECFPQVIYTSTSMPAQDYIPLTQMASYASIDLVYSYTYEMGTDETIDAIFEGHITDGNILWGQADANGYTSDRQPVILLVSDSSAMPIDDIVCTGIDLDVLCYYCDGKGVTTVYAVASNPTSAVSRYTASSINFRDLNSGGISFTKKLNSGRYVYVEYYRELDGETGVAKWLQYLHTDLKVGENYVLTGDLDFESRKLNDVMVNGSFTGKLNGNNHTIKNISYTKLDETKFGSTAASVGLFKEVIGNVRNLILDNISYEGGGYSGILAGTLNGATVDNVFVTNSYVGGGDYVGGLAGYTNGSTQTIITNCGVSDTKIVRFAGTNQFSAITGGLIGYMPGVNTVDKCFAQNVYIESLINSNYNVVGGLIGYMNTGLAKVTNCYATGVINASGDAIGGLIGSIYANVTVESCYSNVDINAFTGNAGGIIGRNLNTSATIKNCIYFGNINSATVMDNGDSRLGVYSLTCVDSGTYSNVKAYEGAHLLVRGEGYTNGIYESTYGSLTYDEFFADGNYGDYLNYTAFTMTKENTFPKLYKTEIVNGESVDVPLHGQSDEYINLDSTINLSNVDVDLANRTIDITVNHNKNIEIKRVYTDYTYVQEQINLANTANTFTNQQALRYSSITSNTKNSEYDVYSIEGINLSVEAYYDIYKITAIKYTENGKEHFMPVNVILDIEPQYKEISNLNEWNTYVGGSHVENFIITGDIDFGGAHLVYNNNSNCNMIINRLIGQKVNDYDSIYEGVYDGVANFPYYRIGNAYVDTTVSNTNGGFSCIYNGSTGFIRETISELKNISFDSITITKNLAASGLVYVVDGFSENLTFTNCSYKSTTGYGNALLTINNGSLKNAYVNNCSVSSAGAYNGILVGYQNSFKRNSEILNTIVENSKVSGGAYTGAVLGCHESSGFPFYSSQGSLNSQSFKMKNNTVINCTITGGESTGGVLGRTDFVIYFDNNNVSSSKITGSSYYTGGVLGRTQYNATSITNCFVYDSTILGYNNYVGGITATYGDIWQCKVDQCIIAGRATYTGGLWGYSYSQYTSKTDIRGNNDIQTRGWVTNTKIYGNAGVGGIMGYGATSVHALGIVENCEIYGNTYVGGVAGDNYYYCSLTPYVTNCIIAPLKANSYGIGVAASQYNFGGLVGTGGPQFGYVDNCVIGGSNVDVVGGISGIYYQYENYDGSCAMCRDCVVIGRNYVGGMFGKCISKAQTTANATMHSCYSNAYVIGNDYVGGIAGHLEAYLPNTTSKQFYNMPVIENSYFTGTLTATYRASAVFGTVRGDNTGLTMHNLVSMPEYIHAETVYPLIIDGTGDYYSVNELLSSSNELMTKDAIKVSLWSNTVVSKTDNSVNMEALLIGDYKNYLGSQDEINAYINGISDTKKVIYLYKDNSEAISMAYEYKGLPSGYTQVDFIRGTGSQGINTLFTPDGNTRVVIDMQFTETTVQQRLWSCDLSSYSNSNYVSFSGYINGNGYWAFSYIKSNTGNWQATRVKADTSRHTFDFDGKNKKYKIDGKLIFDFSSMNVGTATAAYPMRLFKMNLNNNATNENYAKAYIYGAQIYDNGTLVRDYVPAVRDYDGATGLYDIVNNLFYPSTESNYIKGNIVDDPTNITDNIAYITNTIKSFGLTGKSKVTPYFYMGYKNLAELEMPYTGTAILFNDYVYHSIVNPFTGNQDEITVDQGVPIPGTDKFYATNAANKGLYDKYMAYLDSSNPYTYDQFVSDTGLGYKRQEKSSITSYAQDADVLNIEIASNYTQLEYIYNSGYAYINTGLPFQSGKKYTLKFLIDSNYRGSDIKIWGSFQVGLGTISGQWRPVVGYYRTNGQYIDSTGSYTLEVESTATSVTYNINDKQVFTSSKSANTTSNLSILNITGDNSYGVYKICEYIVEDTQHMIPARRNSDGAVGMYDLLNNKFYTNNGSGSLVAGPAVGPLSLYKDITITKDNSEKTLVYSSNDTNALNKSTLSLKYDFSDDLVITTTDIGNVQKTYKVLMSNVAKKASLSSAYNGTTNKVEGYFINPSDSTLYKVDNGVASQYISGKQFVNVVGDKAVDKDGYLYDLTTSTSLGKVAYNLLDTSLPLSTITLSSSTSNRRQIYYTYGDYTYIVTEKLKNDGIHYDAISDQLSDVRYFKKDNQLIILRTNTNATINDYYKYSTYEAYLNTNGSIVSIGSTNLVTLLKNANATYVHDHPTASAFANTGIKSMATNINSNSGVVILTYETGKIEVYDVAKGIQVACYDRISSLYYQAEPVVTTAPKKTFMSFMMMSFNNIFSINNEIDEVENEDRILVDEVVNEMVTTNASLEEIVGITIETPVISPIISNEPVENIDTEINEILSDEAITTVPMLIAKLNNIEEFVSKPAISVEEIINKDTTSTTKEFIKTEEDVIDYSIAYNEETNEFEIYSIDEVMENPEDPLSENKRVVDMSSLKSLYSSMGQKEHDTDNGIVIYVLIAIAIMCLTGVIYILGLKKKAK